MNFRQDFIDNHYEKVASDYERSFIGAFVSELLRNHVNTEVDLYFSIVKFEKNLVFSLTQNEQILNLER